VNRLYIAAILPCCAASLALDTPARADETAGGPQLQPIVVESTAIPGTSIDIDKIPGNVQVLSAADLSREGSASLTTALNSNLSSVNINDDLDDPFQPDILYRGFEASPVLGTPQGLAVYQNGVRINEAFGDTVNWDLFPDIAINQVELVSASPVYGLNALGGAVSVTMKNGFTYQGADLELSGGSYGQRSVVGLSQNTRTPTACEIECSNPLTPCLLPTNLAGDPPNLRQVIAHTAELGLRGKIPDVAGAGSEMSWNLSVFRTLLKDDIYGISTSIAQGFFQNIGDTRRQGVEAGLNYRTATWSAFANYSFVQATFQSPLLMPSPSSPYQDANGNIQVEPGDRLPGIPEHRLKLGADYKIIPEWTVGATVNVVSSVFYVGDQSNQLAPIPGYTVVNLHTAYKPVPHLEVFASINNLFNRQYSTWGILSDPTGISAPGIPPNGVTNGPGVDNRFLSPAAPFEAFGGVRITF